MNGLEAQWSLPIRSQRSQNPSGVRRFSGVRGGLPPSLPTLAGERYLVFIRRLSSGVMNLGYLTVEIVSRLPLVASWR